MNHPESLYWTYTLQLHFEVVYLNNSTYNSGLSVYEISHWDIIQDDMKSSQSEVMDLVGEIVHTR